MILTRGPEFDSIEQSKEQQERPPPEIGMEFTESNVVREWVRQMIDARTENEQAIDKKQKAYEEPDFNATCRLHESPE